MGRKVIFQRNKESEKKFWKILFSPEREIFLFFCTKIFLSKVGQIPRKDQKKVKLTKLRILLNNRKYSFCKKKKWKFFVKKTVLASQKILQLFKNQNFSFNLRIQWARSNFEICLAKKFLQRSDKIIRFFYWNTLPDFIDIKNCKILWWWNLQLRSRNVILKKPFEIRLNTNLILPNLTESRRPKIEQIIYHLHKLIS